MSPRPPRYRYVAFRVDGPRAFSYEEVLAALRAEPGRPWLVGFRDPLGLARCTNLSKDLAIRALRGITAIAGESVTVTTLGTSGTIRRATAKYLRPR